VIRLPKCLRVLYSIDDVMYGKKCERVVHVFDVHA
jgi:hypothetical protein